MRTQTILASIAITMSMTTLQARVNNNYEYVKVYESEPIYKTVRVRVPYEEVVTKRYNVKVPCGGSYSSVDNNSFGIDTLIGTGLGMAVGNQIGRGDGRIAAKIVGGLLGAHIANSQRQPKYTTNYCNETKYVDETVVKYDYTEKRKLQGYKNKFTYNGETYTKITSQPKKRIRVTTRISF